MSVCGLILVCLWLLAPLNETLLVVYPHPLHLQQTVGLVFGAQPWAIGKMLLVH